MSILDWSLRAISQRDPPSTDLSMAMSGPGTPRTGSHKDQPDDVPPVAKKRYNLSLPLPTYEALRRKAAARGTSVADLIRLSIKLGLKVLEAEQDPTTAVILHKDGYRDRELVFP